MESGIGKLMQVSGGIVTGSGTGEPGGYRRPCPGRESANGELRMGGSHGGAGGRVSEGSG